MMLYLFSSFLDKGDGRFRGVTVFNDDICGYDGSASADACDAVDKNIGMFARFLDKGGAVGEVLRYIEGLFVLCG